MINARSAAAWLAPVACLLASCMVGPEFERPETTTADGWSTGLDQGLTSAPTESPSWWTVFDDPVLDQLLASALANNTTLEIAGLRVLEARAQLGIATGQAYPQVQAAAGSAMRVSPADNAPGNGDFWSYDLGATAAWEIDFWGKFRRGVESADAAFLASVAAYQQAQVLLIGAVVSTYTAIRSIEDQVRIAEDNVKLQQRSYEITKVQFENGADSELDMQQALTLLLSTKASIPQLETSLAQARNALSILLGQAPGAVRAVLAETRGIPLVPEQIAIGVPADMLRIRPDVRQAEQLAVAANALVGVAEGALYPSFSLTGTIGVSAGGPGDSDFGDLFDSNALAWSAGPSFTWPFLNYGRIRNNIRVQDARLQQALVNYRDTVLQAAREAEDAMAGFIGAKEQQAILEQTVESARRSNELSTLRYLEGLSDYQRVLDAQQALFNQQQRYINIQAASVTSLVSLYTALGGGWQAWQDLPLVPASTDEMMRSRTNWGGLLDEAPPVEQNNDGRRKPDW